MHLTNSILQDRVPTFNQVSHFDYEFHTILDQYKCQYAELKLKQNGYYLTNKKSNYIFINKKLRDAAKLEAKLHELVHLIIDHPCEFLASKQELHAQIFSLVFLIPKADIIEYSQLKLSEIDYRLHPFLKARWRIYETYKI